jgi:hypothetical protein
LEGGAAFLERTFKGSLHLADPLLDLRAEALIERLSLDLLQPTLELRLLDPQALKATLHVVHVHVSVLDRVEEALTRSTDLG